MHSGYGTGARGWVCMGLYGPRGANGLNVNEHDYPTLIAALFLARQPSHPPLPKHAHCTATYRVPELFVVGAYTTVVVLLSLHLHKPTVPQRTALPALHPGTVHVPLPAWMAIS